MRSAPARVRPGHWFTMSDENVLSLGDRLAQLTLAAIAAPPQDTLAEDPAAPAASAPVAAAAAAAPGVTPIGSDFWDRVLGRKKQNKKTMDAAPPLVSGDPVVVPAVAAGAADTAANVAAADALLEAYTRQATPLGKSSAFEEWIDQHLDDDALIPLEKWLDDHEAGDKAGKGLAAARQSNPSVSEDWIEGHWADDAVDSYVPEGAAAADGARLSKPSAFEEWIDSHLPGDAADNSTATTGTAVEARTDASLASESLDGLVGWWKKRQMRAAEKAAAKEQVGAAEAKRKALEEDLRLREERKKAEERLRAERKTRAVTAADTTKALAALVASLATGPHDQLLRSDSVPALADPGVDAYAAQLAVASALVQARLAAPSAVTTGGTAGAALATLAVTEGQKKATPAQIATIHEYARALHETTAGATLDERTLAQAEGSRLYAHLAALVPARTPALDVLMALGTVWQALHMHATRGALSASTDRLKQFYMAPVQATLVDAATLLGRHFA